VIVASMIWPPTPQVPARRQVGIPVDVGTDEAASNASQNMLEAAKAAAMLQKLTGLDARP
jgi:5-methylthioadenosine/S-adenosylhomocysteine deaminase